MNDIDNIDKKIEIPPTIFESPRLNISIPNNEMKDIDTLMQTEKDLFKSEYNKMVLSSKELERKLLFQ